MSYFRNFSDILYQSQSNNVNSSTDFVRAKNLFRRAKIRDDIFQSAVAFEKYKIIGEERPDQVAEKIYNSPEYDWIVLLSNNIINVRTEWPLSESELYDYISRKYSAEELSQPHHYETTTHYDSLGKLIVPAGKVVDEDFSVTYLDDNLIQDVSVNTQYLFNSNKVTHDSTLVTYDIEEQKEPMGSIITVNPVKSVSNYEYEVDLNDKKRNIYVLKSIFLQTIIDDLEEIMSYKFSSQYVNNSTKKADNLRIISPR